MNVQKFYGSELMGSVSFFLVRSRISLCVRVDAGGNIGGALLRHLPPT
jgi:hypothetical protein